MTGPGGGRRRGFGEDLWRQRGQERELQDLAMVTGALLGILAQHPSVVDAYAVWPDEINFKFTSDSGNSVPQFRVTVQDKRALYPRATEAEQ